MVELKSKNPEVRIKKKVRTLLFSFMNSHFRTKGASSLYIFLLRGGVGVET